MSQQKYAAFGQVLRQARKDMTMTQTEVADAVGICVDWYARIETGNAQCSLTTLAAFRKSLRVDVNTLLKALGQRSKPVEGTASLSVDEPDHTSGPYEVFSRVFRPARLQRHLTLSMVAEAVGYSRSYYYCIETGRRLPSVSMLARLHDCLEFDANSLLEELDKLPSKPDHYHFGVYIARVRAKKAKTIAEAAGVAGCSIEQYQRIEAGARLPTFTELARLHRLLSFNANHALRRIDLERLGDAGDDT
ncbi:MAG: helix-turn-helix domain-containing protein [Proteobacteria bacterium]|nr:helix-turn-helix domain-containing protein [Pseudomonadota bacterium]